MDFRSEEGGEERIDVSLFPAGVYFIKSGGRAGKFVKINY